MTLAEFKRILTAFADGEHDLDLSRGKVMLQVRNELIEAEVSQRDGSLFVSEAGVTFPASQWVIQRVAMLPLLADRLLSHIQQTEAFVPPSGSLMERLDVDASEADLPVEDALSALQSALGKRLLGATSVLYLTSDAGEGKTTIINELARRQAAEYKQKRSDWILVPVQLGGRGFQRFDDAVVATLLNRYRFPMLYFDGFLELVKLGVVVPAFDGFEEVFIESGSGEAVSALGALVGALASSGSCVISARNAYFEYQSYLSQAQLFDAMQGSSAEFGRLKLARWSDKQFEAYAARRGVKSPSQLRLAVETRLGTGHPLIARAVLASRIVDLARDNASVSVIVERLGQNPDDYFQLFVQALVEREATQKWIDRAGDPPRPILTVAEHGRLLAAVAAEMWLATSEVLRTDVLDVVADVFSEMLGRGPIVGRQVRERLRQHSMLAAVDGRGSAFTFDHEDFRKYYLGEHLAEVICDLRASELRTLLRVAALPIATAEAAVRGVLRRGAVCKSALDLLREIASSESRSSFVNENAGLLSLLLLERDLEREVDIDGFVLPPDALSGRTLQSVRFRDCHFQPSRMTASSLRAVSFTDCRFERIEVDKTTRIVGCRLERVEVGALVLLDEDTHLYDPSEIAHALHRLGFELAGPASETAPAEMDEDAKLLERALRSFMRSTQLNEQVLRQKLGVRYNRFEGELLPMLLSSGVLSEVPYHGGGVQRRFRLGRTMQDLQVALAKSGGSFTGFISALR